MAEPYVGEIKMFAGNFAPRGYLLCQGQIVGIAEYDVLFALIGTTYGGDGVSTFALPDLQCRIPIHQGQGGGLSNYPIGSKAGVEQVSLTQASTPVHTHTVAAASSSSGAVPTPTGNVWSANATSGTLQYAASSATPVVAMNSGAIANNGGSVPHDNMAPTTAINFIIAADTGVFPAQN